MKMEECKPQMPSQRNTDVFSSALICENLRHLRFNNSVIAEKKTLREILKKIGI